MPNDLALVVLKKKELAELERMLDAKSWKLHQARKPGAGPGPKERLINEMLEEVIYASAVAP
jgi:hypothetical protein